MNIQGFQKTTLLDYPGYVAATVFTGGCNFCCPFCHNGDLVLTPNGSGGIPEDEVLTYLKKRQRILDGVCISGGEPTLQPGLSDFIRRVKSLGLLVKLDTNGYRPQVLRELCDSGLIDYVAMDIKAAPEKYPLACGVKDMDISLILESVNYLLNGATPYEFRTTVVQQLHTEDDFSVIGKWISGASAYFLQNYVESPRVIAPGFTPYTKEDLTHFQKILQKFIPQVALRGMDG